VIGPGLLPRVEPRLRRRPTGLKMPVQLSGSSIGTIEPDVPPVPR
jgi:hypothetical protein